MIGRYQHTYYYINILTIIQLNVNKHLEQAILKHFSNAIISILSHEMALDLMLSMNSSVIYDLPEK